LLPQALLSAQDADRLRRPPPTGCARQTHVQSPTGVNRSYTPEREWICSKTAKKLLGER